IGADAAVDLDRKTFFGPFVGDRQALQLLTVGAPSEHEVVGPHLVGAGWRVGTRTAGRDALSRALARHLKARLPPQAIGASEAHRVTVAAKEDRDPPVTVTRILRRKLRPAPAPAYPSK